MYKVEFELGVIKSSMKDEFKGKVNNALIEVVYEWACKKDFAEVCMLTTAMEGIVVKTIMRLEILMRSIKNACSVIGNNVLLKKLEVASSLIKRDIVFAASLYHED